MLSFNRILLLAVLLTAFAVYPILANCKNKQKDNNHNLRYDYEDWDNDLNEMEDENCLTDGATCCWSFGLYCPVEVECEGDNDLGDYCIDDEGITLNDIETYDPEEGWIYFRISGIAGSSFHFNASAATEAEDENGNAVPVIGYIWQVSNDGNVENEYVNIPNSKFQTNSKFQSSPATGAVFGLFKVKSDLHKKGQCVNLDDTDTWIRVRPKGIDLSQAAAGSVYTFCVSVGIEADSGL